MHLCGEGDLMMVHHDTPTWKAEVPIPNAGNLQTQNCKWHWWMKVALLPACGISMCINRCWWFRPGSRGLELDISTHLFELGVGCCPTIASVGTCDAKTPGVKWPSWHLESGFEWLWYVWCGGMPLRLTPREENCWLCRKPWPRTSKKYSTTRKNLDMLPNLLLEDICQNAHSHQCVAYDPGWPPQVRGEVKSTRMGTTR